MFFGSIFDSFSFYAAVRMEDCVKKLHEHSDKSSTELCYDLNTLLKYLDSHKPGILCRIFRHSGLIKLLIIYLSYSFVIIGDERKTCVDKLIECSLPSALSSLLTTRQPKEVDLHTKVAEVVAELAKTGQKSLYSQVAQ